MKLDELTYESGNHTIIFGFNEQRMNKIRFRWMQINLLEFVEIFQQIHNTIATYGVPIITNDVIYIKKQDELIMAIANYNEKLKGFTIVFGYDQQ